MGVVYFDNCWFLLCLCGVNGYKRHCDTWPEQTSVRSRGCALVPGLDCGAVSGPDDSLGHFCFVLFSVLWLWTQLNRHPQWVQSSDCVYWRHVDFTVKIFFLTLKSRRRNIHDRDEYGSTGWDCAVRRSDFKVVRSVRMRTQQILTRFESLNTQQGHF